MHTWTLWTIQTVSSVFFGKSEWINIPEPLLLKIIIGYSVNEAQRSDRQTQLNRWTDRWTGRQTSPKYSWALTPMLIHISVAVWRRRKKTALIPVVPHILARGRTAHPNLSTRVCYERVTHFGWDHSLVHVCVSIPLTCMGTKHQGDIAAGMEGYTVKQHINNKE